MNRNYDDNTLEFRIFYVPETGDEESMGHYFFKEGDLDDTVRLEDLDYLKNGYGFALSKDDNGNVGITVYKGLRDNATITLNSKLTKVVNATMISSPEEGVSSTITYERDILGTITVGIHAQNEPDVFMENWKYEFPTKLDWETMHPTLREECRIGDYYINAIIDSSRIQAYAKDSNKNYIEFHRLNDERSIYADNTEITLDSAESVGLMKLYDEKKTYKIQLPEDIKIVSTEILDDSTKEQLFAYVFDYDKLK